MIRQEHTYTTLDISRELFEDLLHIYGAFSPIWKVAFTFGRKSEQNEFAFPGIRARRSLTYESPVNDIHGSCESISSTPDACYRNKKYFIDLDIESACVIRRVELHGRELEDGQPPWSIRQTGVYHKLTAPTDSACSVELPKSMFILIAPSKKFEKQLSHSLELSIADCRAIGPWNIYRLLIAESLGGWLDYMTWLEDSLKEQVRLT